ncbi:ATP-binding cassette domain-containing protein [Peptoniphilus sp.]|uniref:ATP-binding cassette domain-containing protein n=1 Tax=Peptoniphilus sp. TaxID=1971214 RepID=UPI003994C394
MLEIKNLNKSFGDNVVLSDFNLKVEDGERVAIVGKSGSGKTTLLKIISKEIKDFDGKVTIDTGVRISMVFQDNLLFENRTVLENLKFVSDMDSHELEKLLLELGLQNTITQKVKNLSGGMKRRVSFLRALLVPADLLLMDEAIREVDSESEDLMIEYLDSHFHGTIIFVTHSESQVEKLKARKVEI